MDDPYSDIPIQHIVVHAYINAFSPKVFAAAIIPFRLAPPPLLAPGE